MNKPTKFRAWDNETKVFVTNMIDVFINDSGTIFTLDPTEEEKEVIRECNYDIQFTTGLKDKNKKEIFDGDLVSDGKTIFQVEWNQQQSGYWTMPVKTLINEDVILYSLNANVLGNGYFDRKDLEVIGNIYENADLIK